MCERYLEGGFGLGRLTGTFPLDLSPGIRSQDVPPSAWCLLYIDGWRFAIELALDALPPYALARHALPAGVGWRISGGSRPTRTEIVHLSKGDHSNRVIARKPFLDLNWTQESGKAFILLRHGRSAATFETVLAVFY